MKIIIPHNTDRKSYFNIPSHYQEHLHCPSEENLYKIAKLIEDKIKEEEDPDKCLILIDDHLYFKEDGNSVHSSAVDLIEMLRIIGVRNLIIFRTLKVNNEPRKLLNDNINNLILFTNGVKIILAGKLKEYLDNKDDDFGECDYDHIRPFIEANFRQPEDKRHSWANMWGIDRMISAHNKLLEELKDRWLSEELWEGPLNELRSRRPDLSEENLNKIQETWSSEEMLKELLKDKFDKQEKSDISDKSLDYQRAAYLYDISENNSSWKENIDSKKLIDFIIFKRQRRKPGILYIDDQADPWWSVLFKRIIYGSKDTIKFKSVPRKEVTNYENINKMIQEHKPELILLDLRLEKNESGTDISIDKINELSGAKILEKIKKEHPGLPIIITTASNKQWIYSALKRLGADAYWTKEGIDTTASLSRSDNEKYCIQNYLDFIAILTHFQDNKEEYDLLRRLGKLKKELETAEIENAKTYWWEEYKWDKYIRDHKNHEGNKGNKGHKDSWEDYWWRKNRHKLKDIKKEDLFSRLDKQKTRRISREEISKHVSSVFYLYFSYLQIGFGNKYEEIEESWYWFSWILQHFGKVLERIHCMDKIVDNNIKLFTVASARNDDKGMSLSQYRNYASHIKVAQTIMAKEFMQYVDGYIQYIQCHPNEKASPEGGHIYECRITERKGSGAYYVNLLPGLDVLVKPKNNEDNELNKGDLVKVKVLDVNHNRFSVEVVGSVKFTV